MIRHPQRINITTVFEKIKGIAMPGNEDNTIS